MREGLWPGRGSRAPRGRQRGVSGFLSRCGTVAAGQDAQMTPEMHGLRWGTLPTLCASKKEEKELFQGAASSTHGAWREGGKSEGLGGTGGQLNPGVQPSCPEILGTGSASKEERERAAQLFLLLFLLPQEAPELGRGLRRRQQGLQPRACSARPRAPPDRSLQRAEQRGGQLPEDQGRVSRTQHSAGRFQEAERGQQGMGRQSV